MSALQLSEFGVCFGHRVILSSVDLSLPAQGVDVLMGPVKTGKSTLMRTLAGLNATTAIHRHWGSAQLAGRPVDAGWRPTLVQQHAALFKSSVRDAVLAQSAAATRAMRDEAAGHALAAHGLPGMADALGQSVLGLPVHQQRAINILAHALPSPPLLMVDEPTYGLPPDAALWLVDWLRALAGKVRLLVTLHHQGQARRLADRVVLLGGGAVLAHELNPRFFTHPANGWVRQFVHSGSLSVPSPDARPEDLDPSAPPPPPLPQAALDALAEFAQRCPAAVSAMSIAPPTHTSSPSIPLPAPPPAIAKPTPGAAHGAVTPSPPMPRSVAAPVTAVGAPLPPLSRAGVETASMVGKAIMTEYRGPHGFHWILPGTLAGCGEPGAMAPIDYDMQLLANLGISHLVTLTEKNLDEDALDRNGLKNIHLPIFDREAPSLTQAYMLVRRMQLLLDRGHVIAVHCKAGIGRTGTVLAAWLIREGGLSAADAITRLRNIHTYYVQTREQEIFLEQFEQDILRRM